MPGRSPSRAVPEALVSPQRSWAPATVNAQTFAPTTGAPAAIVTITASVLVAPDALGAADGGGELAWQATTSAARSARNGRGRDVTPLCSPRARCRLLPLGLRKGCKKVRNLGEWPRDLLALLPVHEIAHGLADGLAFAQHEVCLLGDGHHDATLCRSAVGRLSGRHALGDLTSEALRDLAHRDALREHLADHPVARELARAGGDEVAETRQTSDGERVRAFREPVARDLREAARDEPSFGVLAVAHAIDRARAERDDVLQRSAQLHADDVGVRVDAEHRRPDERLEMPGRRSVDGRDDRGRREAGGDLSADVRPGEDRDSIRRDGFGPELAHPPAVFGKAFRRGEDAVLFAEPRRHAIAEVAYAPARRGDDEIVRRERALEIGRHLDAVGHADPGEVLAILASRRDLLRLRGVADPEDHVLATIAREDGREGRAPGSGLEHAHRHEVPTRGSTPRTMRSMFALCRMKTTVPAITMNARVHQLKWSHPV